MKLMIVDDNLQVREGIAYGINWQEYGIDAVCSCADGLEALQKINVFSPDIVIADICMNLNTVINRFSDKLIATLYQIALHQFPCDAI